MARNRLAEEASPYLLQHADNPVHWYAWRPEAFAAAKRENKPILLSVGYAACHWCHVMAHESFEDPETAELMNRLFVSIKVDREERPDIDAIYQSALQLLGEHGGWPLTMFLTPEGEPFWGGTYFPKEARFGRPAFKAVLEGIHRIFRDEPDKVRQNREALGQALQRLSSGTDRGALAPDAAERVAAQLLRVIDPVHGGLGQAPKFPQPFLFELLWRAYLRSGDDRFRAAVDTTLTHIAQGGVYDHLGGGFHRYSVDERWLVPHFEKMLYDNALLVSLYTLVWQETGNPLYAARIRETVDWVLREMVAEGGAFAATLDADSEGEEGKFYVWSLAEVDEVLGSEADLFKRVYDVTPLGNWEGTNILNRLHALDLLGPEDEARLAEMRAHLLKVRDTRVRPGWDDKVLADWNGLMIAALVRAATALAEPLWLEAAARAFKFITDTMVVHDRLRHSWRLGKLQQAELLDDHANMAQAALALYEVSGDPIYLDWARRWVTVLDARYWDAANGGYFYTPDDAETLIARTRSAYDAATPNGNGVMVEVLGRLYHLTGEEAYRDRAEAVVSAFAGEIERNPLAAATLLNSFDFLQHPIQVAIIGRRDQPEMKALLHAASARGLPGRVLQVVAPDATLPPHHPAQGKTEIDGRPTAYVCVGPVCSLPLTEPEGLAAALAPDAVRRMMAA